MALARAIDFVTGNDNVEVWVAGSEVYKPSTECLFNLMSVILSM